MLDIEHYWLITGYLFRKLQTVIHYVIRTCMKTYVSSRVWHIYCISIVNVVKYEGVGIRWMGAFFSRVAYRQ